MVPQHENQNALSVLQFIIFAVLQFLLFAVFRQTPLSIFEFWAIDRMILKLMLSTLRKGAGHRDICSC